MNVCGVYEGTRLGHRLYALTGVGTLVTTWVSWMLRGTGVNKLRGWPEISHKRSKLGHGPDFRKKQVIISVIYVSNCMLNDLQSTGFPYRF